VPASILNLFFMGEGPPQWLATGALECRSGVALQPEPGAPQPNRNKNLHGPNVPSQRSGLEPVSLFHRAQRLQRSVAQFYLEDGFWVYRSKFSGLHRRSVNETPTKSCPVIMERTQVDGGGDARNSRGNSCARESAQDRNSGSV